MVSGSLLLKRAFDLVASLLGLVVLSPLLVALAIAVRATSAGPVLYAQTRLGRHGKPFRLYKFRTMVVGADASSRLTAGADPRITRIGGFLRRTNLDELPQLFNVLKGDMSLVGPRPEVPEFVDLTDPLWLTTLSVQPGMTAPVTVEFRNEAELLGRFRDPVEGYRREVLPRKLELNREYVETRTFLGDLAVILATFRDILAGRGHEDTTAPVRVLGIRVTRGRRLLFFLAVDAMLLVAAFALAALLRHDGAVPRAQLPGLAVTAGIVTASALVLSALLGVYRVSWGFVGLRDLAWQGLALAGAIATGFFAVTLFHHDAPFSGLPRTILLIALPISFCLTGAFRLSKRALRALEGVRTESKGAPTLIIGAGNTGAQVVKSLRESVPASPYHVVGFVDDDRLAWGTSIHGIAVLGGLHSLEAHLREHEVEVVVICIATAPGALVRELVSRCRKSGVKTVRIVPPVSQLVDGRVTFEATREVSLEDLLGREVVKVDHEDLRRLIGGRRILVTGGAGTIGSELCRQIARLRPERLVILDVDETRLHDLAVDLEARHPDVHVVQALVDVRHRDDLGALLTAQRPHILFHAAAYKHVPMMERYPLAALEVNVLGTANVAELAEAAGCERFILISTDKAVEPSSVMGASKRLGELVVFSPGASGRRMRRSAVRFGNVIGSRGSVIPTFERQVREGGPVTVTHPDMERYFMMTSEAVSLVLQAAALGAGNDVFILDMGKAVRILDVARELIRLSGHEPDVDIPIKITGLRPGEKLREVLTYPHEVPHATTHPRILRVGVQARTADQLLEQVAQLVQERDVDDARAFMDRLFPTLVGGSPPQDARAPASAPGSA